MFEQELLPVSAKVASPAAASVLVCIYRVYSVVAACVRFQQLVDRGDEEGE